MTNVFDMDKDLGGISEWWIMSLATWPVNESEVYTCFCFSLELKGIPRQAYVGFLTILEALRYCEV